SVLPQFDRHFIRSRERRPDVAGYDHEGRIEAFARQPRTCVADRNRDAPPGCLERWNVAAARYSGNGNDCEPFASCRSERHAGMSIAARYSGNGNDCEPFASANGGEIPSAVSAKFLRTRPCEFDRAAG